MDVARAVHHRTVGKDYVHGQGPADTLRYQVIRRARSAASTLATMILETYPHSCPIYAQAVGVYNTKGALINILFRAPSTKEGVLLSPSRGLSVCALLILMVYSISYHTHTSLAHIPKAPSRLLKTPVQRPRQLWYLSQPFKEAKKEYQLSMSYITTSLNRGIVLPPSARDHIV